LARNVIQPEALTLLVKLPGSVHVNSDKSLVSANNHSAESGHGIPFGAAHTSSDGASSSEPIVRWHTDNRRASTEAV
jgi:hypothetical protein